MSIVSKFFANKSLAFPYIQITGKITRQTTIFVESMLNKLPSKTTKLGVVINSDSGSPAQAHIINTKLSILSKRRGIEIYTFIEDAAVNAGFLLATSGQKIFADNTSIIGGLEVSNKKIVLGDFINRISYKNESSLSSQLSHTQQMDPAKKTQVQKVYNQFSQQMEFQIKKSRGLNENVDLKNVFNAKEAKQNGLIDEIGRINQVIPQQFSQFELKRLEKNAFDKIRNDLRKLNVW